MIRDKTSQNLAGITTIWVKQSKWDRGEEKGVDKGQQAMTNSNRI